MGESDPPGTFRERGDREGGSEPTAAGGGRREASEWQRSKFCERIASKEFRAPQQESENRPRGRLRGEAPASPSGESGLGAPFRLLFQCRLSLLEEKECIGVLEMMELTVLRYDISIFY